MESNLKEKRAVHATVEVTMDAGRVDAAFDTVLGQYARQVRVPGFRPGKAPRGVLRKKIGEEALAGEVRESLVDAAYPEVVREHELQPIHAHVHGDAPKPGEPFTFELHVDLYPEFELPDVHEIVIDADEEPVTDSMIEETVENLRREHATLVPAERPVEATDQVMIETVGEDDEPREEGSVMPVDMETVGDAIAGQLLNHAIGDVVELTLEDPSKQDEEGTPGTTTMRVRIQDVKAKEKPETDDEFAKTLGFESWDEVAQAIRDSHENQARQRADEERREEFVEKLLEATEIETPGHLLNRRKAALLENLAEDLKKQGIEMRAYLENLENDGKREPFEQELQQSAERSVKRDLVLEKLLEAHPTEVSDEEFDAAVTHLASRERTTPAAFREDRGDEWLANYRFLLMRDKALRTVVARQVAKQKGEEPDDEPNDEPNERP